MSDNEKCQNEGCSGVCTNSGEWDLARKHCKGYTTTPTTSIPTAALEQYKRLTSYGVGEIDRLQDKIAELEADKERVDWLADKCTTAHDSERYLQRRVYWGAGTTRTIRAAIDKARK